MNWSDIQQLQNNGREQLLLDNDPLAGMVTP